ncbi:MAG: membrane integrity-associated transporter subunit PqiC [Geminicoccaceae bacterium]
MRLGRRAYLGGLAFMVALAGCATTKPTNFYTLSRATEPQASKLAAHGLVIGLGPVTVPQYLDRPDIVTREGANQMRLAEFSKWAESLEPLVTRIMAEDLYTLLDASDVIPLPQRGDVPLDRVVEVDIGRFDADASGQVVLDARWRVYKGDNATLLASGRSMITEQGTPVPGYDGIVAAMSRALGRTSDEIARAIAAPPQAPARRARTAG